MGTVTRIPIYIAKSPRDEMLVFRYITLSAWSCVEYQSTHEMFSSFSLSKLHRSEMSLEAEPLKKRTQTSSRWWVSGEL